MNSLKGGAVALAIAALAALPGPAVAKPDKDDIARALAALAIIGIAAAKKKNDPDGWDEDRFNAVMTDSLSGVQSLTEEGQNNLVVDIILGVYAMNLGGLTAMAAYDRDGFCARGAEIRAELAEDTEGKVAVLAPAEQRAPAPRSPALSQPGASGPRETAPYRSIARTVARNCRAIHRVVPVSLNRARVPPGVDSRPLPVSTTSCRCISWPTSRRTVSTGRPCVSAIRRREMWPRYSAGSALRVSNASSWTGVRMNRCTVAAAMTGNTGQASGRSPIDFCRSVPIARMAFSIAWAIGRSAASNCAMFSAGPGGHGFCAVVMGRTTPVSGRPDSRTLWLQGKSGPPGRNSALASDGTGAYMRINSGFGVHTRSYRKMRAGRLVRFFVLEPS